MDRDVWEWLKVRYLQMGQSGVWIFKVSGGRSGLYFILTCIRVVSTIRLFISYHQDNGRGARVSGS